MNFIVHFWTTVDNGLEVLRLFRMNFRNQESKGYFERVAGIYGPLHHNS